MKSPAYVCCIIHYYFTTPAGKKSGLFETDYDSAGEYILKISASDGTDTVSKEVNLKIENIPKKTKAGDLYQLLLVTR